VDTIAGVPATGTTGTSGASAGGTSTSTGSGSSSTGGGSGSSSHAGIPNTLLLNGSASDVARAQALLTQIDIAVPQLHFEARVVDLENADTQQLGMRYDFSQPVYVGETQTGKDGILNSGGSAATVAVNTASGLARNLNFGAIYRTPYAIGLTLDALANNNHTRTLANPNLSALDGEPATAFIGDQVKFVTSITQGTNGPNITTDTATVGITLKVTGKYSPDGTITLYVHPEVSNVSSYLTLTTGISLPQISTRYVDTTIRIKDGETIAIGGLIQEQDVRNIQKIPFLGDLPFFGKLFSSANTTKNRSNIVVFITSHVLKD
jgi:type II secretory pathway component GspD/PulD (secretin)